MAQYYSYHAQTDIDGMHKLSFSFQKQNYIITST